MCSQSAAGRLSPVDLAELGGWSNVDTLQQDYQQADLESMERVLEEEKKYRLG